MQHSLSERAERERERCRSLCALRPRDVVKRKIDIVERVFSQLAFIRRAVGDKVSRDVLELRTLIRVNNGLMEDYRAKI